MITITNGTAKLGVNPYRGANTCFWKIGDQDIIYVEPSSYKSKDIKFVGGNPIMFPIFSTLGLHGQSKLSYDGYTIQLSQHGLARLSSLWRANQSAENQIKLYLTSSPESLKIFPWEFLAELTYTLGESSLVLEQKVTNIGSKMLPFVMGFHPYFAVSDPKNCEVQGVQAGKPCYFVSNFGKGNNLNAHLPTSLPFGRDEINHHFINEAQKLTLTDRMTGRQICVVPDLGYPCATIWSEPLRPFVCIEPVTGRRGAFETRENLIRLAVGQEWSGKIHISVSP